ncbi:MAG: signal peptidase I [Nocardioides sp.]|nr:signal peptidase I [Nocardioides sp.]
MAADDVERDRVDPSEGDPGAVAAPPGGDNVPVPDTPDGEPGRGRARSSLPVWQESILLLGLALVFAVVIKAVLAQAFYIPSESMEPGLVKNDRILVQKVSYWFGGEPQRGDVVVFEDPGGWLGPGEDGDPQGGVAQVLSAVGLYPSGGHLVKRVVGVEGDVITCCDERGRILVNGVPLDEAGYAKLDQAQCYGPMTGTCSWTAGPVPADKVFVMGDNRSHSGDSTEQMCTEVETECVPGREFVSDELVVGKVAGVLWPFSHARRLTRPDSFADVPSAE